jgi:hypothetical protein
MALDEWIEKAHGKENHAPRPRPKKKVVVSDTEQGYLLKVSRGSKLIEQCGPSKSLNYIMGCANAHCGFDDEPKRPTLVDREGEKTI